MLNYEIDLKNNFMRSVNIKIRERWIDPERRPTDF